MDEWIEGVMKSATTCRLSRDSLSCSSTHPPVRSPTHPLIRSSTHPTIQLSIYPFVRLVIACSVGVLVLCGCKPKPAVDPKPAAAQRLTLAAADLAEAKAVPVQAGVYITGTLQPAEQVVVKAQTGGQLLSVPAATGTIVTQRQVLAEIDLRSIQAQAEGVRARWSAAEKEFHAAEILFKAGAMSERAHLSAKVNLDSAKAQLVQAETELEHGKITAPIIGVVSDRYVSVGEVVAQGQSAFKIVSSDILELATYILPHELIRVRVDQPVAVALEIYPGRVFPGTVVRINPIADAQTRRVGIFIHVPNKPQALVGGLFASGTILTEGAPQTKVVVPASAVRAEGQERVVYRLEGDRLRRQVVAVDEKRSTAETVAIDSGLEAGAKVLLIFGEGIKDGAQVNLLTAAKTGE